MGLSETTLRSILIREDDDYFPVIHAGRKRSASKVGKMPFVAIDFERSSRAPTRYGCTFRPTLGYRGCGPDSADPIERSPRTREEPAPICTGIRRKPEA